MPRKNSRAPTLRNDEPKRRIWRHNSFFGHARMMQAQCEAIIHADSTNVEAKESASRIINETKILTRALKERMDK